MNKEEAKEAIRKISNIIDQWTDMKLDDRDTLELLEPLLQTLITYFDLDPAGEKKLNEDQESGLKLRSEDLETPGAEESEVKKEELQDSESESGDLFSKEESGDLEAKDESKSKSKSKKSFAGSDGEIPF